MRHSTDPAAAHIRFLCVDKTDIRHMISKSKKMDVKQVPCVVLYYPDGRMEKYEGAGVDQWILDQIVPPQPPPPPPPEVGEIYPEEPEDEAPSRSTQIASQTPVTPGNSVMDIPTNAITKDTRSVAEIAEEMQQQRKRAMDKSKNDNRPM